MLSPPRNAARTKGRLPAVFDAEASCDLDRDGFTDLVVSTDPPYDGQGQPPVPLQILFGSPDGLTGRAVQLAVPARARFCNDWPDQPVCGDFDGDGAKDLVVHASGGRLSFLRGPFSRTGAPRAAGAPIPSPGEVPTGPAADVDRDGYDDLVVRATEGTATSAVLLGGPNGPTRAGTVLPAGVDVALGRFSATATAPRSARTRPATPAPPRPATRSAPTRRTPTSTTTATTTSPSAPRARTSATTSTAAASPSCGARRPASPARVSPSPTRPRPPTTTGAASWPWAATTPRSTSSRAASTRPARPTATTRSSPRSTPATASAP